MTKNQYLIINNAPYQIIHPNKLSYIQTYIQIKNMKSGKITQYIENNNVYKIAGFSTDYDAPYKFTHKDIIDDLPDYIKLEIL